MQATHVEVERHDGVRVLRLAHGKANTLTPDVCRELTAALAAAEVDGDAVVVTGAGAMFSAGIDLHRLLADTGRVGEFREALVESFSALFHYPHPTVAAVNGNAVGGGAICAAACDYRIMCRGRGRIGTPELRGGIPFPDLGVEILRQSASPGVLVELALRGALYSADQARAIGLVNEVVDPDQLPAAALATARVMRQAPGPLYSWTKRQLRGDATRPDVTAVWDDDAVIASITSYVEGLGHRP
ncbi:enoyl-CoA hydratase/isomerase family protein [Saccharothrix sp. S26]|uniref:enoyl-CoA hydratase/isomerase family protein n=1 Tax=Saccharothrix sp. S26 TaxID=2907215 RepID=UPI001F29CC30|nr:enoyl-CoA hydratase/isomerase family protein [Saccharothrix sp. S26]MCE6998461.1 enoyl-CoA hydratase/isomerase family protein [Saccharothrix sp. S26]